MGKLIPVSWRVLVKKLRALGFEGPLAGGKHPFMIKGNVVLTLPNKHKKEISVELLRRILKEGGISITDWNKL